MTSTMVLELQWLNSDVMPSVGLGLKDKDWVGKAGERKCEGRQRAVEDWDYELEWDWKDGAQARTSDHSITCLVIGPTS